MYQIETKLGYEGINMENVNSIVSNTIVEHAAFTNAIKAYDQAINAVGSMNNSIGFPLMGESRVGKTTLLTKLKNKYPAHRNEDGVIQPVVLCNVAPQPTMRGMALSLLKGLNDPTIDMDKTSGEKGERVLKAKAIKQIKECGVKAVIFDESQHLARDPNSKSTYAATEWIKTLMDETNVVLIMAGLESTNNLFEQNEQLLGRCRSTIRLTRFDWLVEQSRLEFLGILQVFQHRMQPLEMPELTDHEIAFRFYLATGGLIGYLSKLLTQIVWDADTEKRKIVKMEHFAEAYEKTMRVSELNQTKNPFVGKSKLSVTEETINVARSVGVHIPIPRKRR